MPRADVQDCRQQQCSRQWPATDSVRRHTRIPRWETWCTTGQAPLELRTNWVRGKSGWCLEGCPLGVGSSMCKRRERLVGIWTRYKITHEHSGCLRKTAAMHMEIHEDFPLGKVLLNFYSRKVVAGDCLTSRSMGMQKVPLQVSPHLATDKSHNQHYFVKDLSWLS